MAFFCHQFWWKFRWFDENGEFLSDKNITNYGDNNSFRFWVLFVTNFSENSSDLKKLVSFWVKKMSPILVTIISFDFGFFLSQKLAKIQGNHQNWWQFCRKSMWSHICQNFHNFLWKCWWFEFSFEFSANFSPILVKILVIWRNWWVFVWQKCHQFSKSTNISKKNHQNWWHFTHWKCHQNWWKIIHQKKWKF